MMANQHTKIRGPVMPTQAEIEDRFILLQSLCNIPTGILASHYSDLDSEAQDMFRSLHPEVKVDDKK